MDSELLAKIPSYLALLAVTLAAFAGLLRMRRLLFPEHLVLVIVLINMITDMYANFLAEQGTPTTRYYNVSTVLEQSLTICAYAFMSKQKTTRRLFIVLSMILIIFSILNMSLIQGTDELNTYTFIPAGLLVIALSYRWLRQVVMEKEVGSNDLLVWFAGANFIYYTVMTPVMSVIPWAIKHAPELAHLLYQVNVWAYFAWAILIGTGFICKKKKDISYLLS